jgi:hypothetical protein
MDARTSRRAATFLVALEGEEAARAGEPVSANPYETGTFERLHTGPLKIQVRLPLPPDQGVGAISGARSAALNHPVTGRFPPTYST